QVRVAAKDAELKCDVSRRVKDLWAYYDTANKILLQQIETPIEIIILVSSISDCYRALGVVNQTFRPIPRTIRDFIANPKPTGYQGLHARAIVGGQRFLFKIRTEKMARKAQRGVFSNWSSKSGKQAKFIVELKEMLDIIGSDETVSYRDLIAAGGNKEIYTYTPQGDLICLPPGYKLQDGQMVRIVRAKDNVAFPQEMLKRCQTPKARAELNKSFRLRGQKVACHIGEATLQQEMLRYGLPRDLLESEDMSKVVESFSLKKKSTLFSRIGSGRIRLPEVIESIRQHLFGGASFLVKPTGEFNKIKLNTFDPVFIKLSSCCNPNPAEKMNCALLMEKALSVHHKNCPKLHEVKFQREDAVDISWDRSTPITKQQSILFIQCSRSEALTAAGAAPSQMKIIDMQRLADYSAERQEWELKFEVKDLYGLQKILRHFDKTGLDYEFHLNF
ncbi:MAG: bifunctional (p)ppGpp synthetase/guanosine-3',5'-bis(diphosphate) 3'-pyrophosphohydrolase, partial [Desulfofustis sp.]